MMSYFDTHLKQAPQHTGLFSIPTSHDGGVFTNKPAESTNSEKTVTTSQDSSVQISLDDETLKELDALVAELER